MVSRVGNLRDIYGQNECRDFMQDTHLHKIVAQTAINKRLRFPQVINEE